MVRFTATIETPPAASATGRQGGDRMASSRERDVGESAAEPIDFRNLLLGAWPDGGEDEPDAAGATSPDAYPADDPQWITWSDTSAETAWAAIEIALTLGAASARALIRHPR
jgi:hypothetical protein